MASDSVTSIPSRAAIGWLGPEYRTMSAAADEGMWLVNDPPRQLLKDKYGFDLTDAWLIRAQKTSVRWTAVNGTGWTG